MKSLFLGPLALLLACGDSAGPSTNASDYLGEWTVSVDARTNCWPAFSLRFDLTAEETATIDTQLQAITQWWFTSDPTTVSTVVGHIFWQPEKFDFSFSNGPATPDGDTGDFIGTHVETDQLRGTFYDTDGLFSGDVFCQAGAVATKH